MTLTRITNHQEIEARTAWAIMAHPGDEIAHHLIQALGHVEALDLVMHATSPGTSSQRQIPLSVLSRWLPGGFRAFAPHLSFALEQTKNQPMHMVDPSSVPGLNDLGPWLPHAIWVRGDIAALEVTERIALIGSRACTTDGDQTSMEIAGDLARSGISVHSTAGYGVDQSANRGSLRADGPTVAWMAGGLDRFYPVGNVALFERIEKTSHCAVVSAMPPGVSPTKARFVWRGRFLAAATRATVVVEMSNRSGAFSIVSKALQLGRAVGAVPGPITSPQSAGCHQLIRENSATLITSADDVRELLEG